MSGKTSQFKNTFWSSQKFPFLPKIPTLSFFLFVGHFSNNLRNLSNFLENESFDQTNFYFFCFTYKRSVVTTNKKEVSFQFPNSECKGSYLNSFSVCSHTQILCFFFFFPTNTLSKQHEAPPSGWHHKKI